MHAFARRPATVLATSVLLAAAALAMPKAHAACGEQRDFLVHADPLLAPVRPADCATLLDGPPEFTWPHQDGQRIYTVALRFPDGHTETRTTDRNWLAWDRAVPDGEYTWRVSVAGDAKARSDSRVFRVERPQHARRTASETMAKQAPAPVREAASDAASTASGLFRLEPAESWVPAPKAAQPARGGVVGGFFGGFTQ